MVCDTKEDQDWTECWIFMASLMQTGLEIWIREDLQVGIIGIMTQVWHYDKGVVLDGNSLR